MDLAQAIPRLGTFNSWGHCTAQGRVEQAHYRRVPGLFENGICSDKPAKLNAMHHALVWPMSLTRGSHCIPKIANVGQDFTLSLVGGSVTEGHGGTPTHPSWGVALIQMISLAFNNTAGIIRLVNGARGASTSAYMSLCLSVGGSQQLDTHFRMSELFEGFPKTKFFHTFRSTFPKTRTW